MRIVHIVTSTGVGGAQIMLLRYLQALGSDKSDHSVISLLPDGEIGELIAKLGVEVHDLSTGQNPGPLGAIIALRRVLSRIRPDVIHAWMYHACLAAWLARVVGPRPSPRLIWGIHHSLQDIRNEKLRSRVIIRTLAFLSPLTDVVTYCSEVSQRQHHDLGFNRHRSALIPNATDVDAFRPDSGAKARLATLCGIPEGRIILGNVARSHPMKDHPSMVRATATLVKRGYDVQAVIVGEGHEGSPAQALAGELGLSDRVIFLPVGHAIQDLVPGFDIFVLSSAWGEAFSIALTEAMAAEVPSVVTDVGDSAQVVAGCGLSVGPGRPDNLADAIASLIDVGEDRRRELGRTARQRVIENYTLAEYVRQHLEVYDATTQGMAKA